MTGACNVWAFNTPRQRLMAFLTQVLRTPMQENQVKIAPHVLPVFASGSLQSEDVSTPVILSLPYVERLKPLADYWAAWSCLPNISQWVLRTIRHGYTIQFRKGPPPFSGVLPMTVRPWESSILSQEIVSLLEKGAIEEIPPTQMESGFYSRYFVVPKKVWGLASFKSCTQGHQETQEVPQVCFRGQSLPISCSTVRIGSGPSDIYKVYGRSSGPVPAPGHPNPTKECPGAVSANNLLGGGHRLVHNAGTSVPRTCKDVTDLSEPIQVGASNPCRFMSEIVGTDGTSVPCSSVGPAPHAAVSMVDQKSRHYGDAQRLSHFRSMEEPPFPSGGSPARSVLSSQNYHDGRIPYGLGGGRSRTPSLWSLDRGASVLAHKSF
ncbi:hypothetical protein M9458_055094 [Cirrhinus mrigala]|uniref:Uncharacterized protein n=1 Tax=Cirrhinus mrigala TaxID=683832 RepID=A0ABD0MHN0_CIRMR